MARRLRFTRLEDRLAPAIATWDGGGTDNNWTTAENWVGDFAPQAGDDLVFPDGAARLTNVNDFEAGTAFRSLTFLALGYQVSGNSISLAQGITVDAPRNPSGPDNPLLSIDIGLDEAQTWIVGEDSGLSFTGALALNGHALSGDVGFGVGGAGLLMTGSISGSGALSKDGAGFWKLAGDNSYSGVTDVRAGYLIVSSSFSLGLASAGNETQVEAGANLLLEPLDNSEPIVFAGTAGNPAHLILSNLGNSNINLRGQITLAGPTEFLDGVVNVLTGIGETGGAQGLTLNEFAAVNFVAGSNNTYSGATVIHGGAQLDGTGPFGPVTVVGDGAFVMGTGPIGPVSVEDGGRLMPGAGGQGTMSSRGLNVAGPSFNMPAGNLSINLFADGNSNRVDVEGQVRLFGDLTAQIVFPLPPAIGTRWRIITNDGVDPVVGSFNGLVEGAVVQDVYGRAQRITYRGGDGNDVELFIDHDRMVFAAAVDAGGPPVVQILGLNAVPLRTILAYDPSFLGGVRVATADVNGDGVEDLITAPGPGGGPHIKVFDGLTFEVVREFMAYDPAFTGGVFVAAGDMNDDGRADVITGPGTGGGPHVKAFSGTDNSVLASFMAYDLAFTGGVTVASNHNMIVTGPGPGGGPHVKQFLGNGTFDGEVLAFDASFRGGVFVSTLQGTNQGWDPIVVSAGAGGGPHVRMFGSFSSPQFFAYAADFTGGVRIAGADVDGDGFDEIVTSPGVGGGALVEVWKLTGGSDELVVIKLQEFVAFPSFTGGIFVG